ATKAFTFDSNRTQSNRGLKCWKSAAQNVLMACVSRASKVPARRASASSAAAHSKCFLVIGLLPMYGTQSVCEALTACGCTALASLLALLSPRCHALALGDIL